MTKTTNNSGQWKSGQSGNPKGRPPKTLSLAEIMRVKGEETIFVGAEVMTRNQALAKLVWQYVSTGEVKLLNHKRLVVKNVEEWLEALGCLILMAGYTPLGNDAETVVRVMREAPS